MKQAFSFADRALDSSTRLLELRGEFDLTSAPDVERWIGDSIADGMRRLIVDMSAVELFDSTMLSVLLRARNRLESGEASPLAVVCPGRDVCEIFEVTGLTRVLHVVASLDEALRAFAASGDSGAPSFPGHGAVQVAPRSPAIGRQGRPGHPGRSGSQGRHRRGRR